jgi:hypothetical protein
MISRTLSTSTPYSSPLSMKLTSWISLSCPEMFPSTFTSACALMKSLLLSGVWVLDYPLAETGIVMLDNRSESLLFQVPQP